jgi:hypothetical protein
MACGLSVVEAREVYLNRSRAGSRQKKKRPAFPPAVPPCMEEV